jgi:hypothetical protein
VIELRDSQTHVLEKRVLSLRKHAPVSENCAEVKIDQENRVLLVDGKPFFPVGIWTGQLSDDWLGLYKELGFNTLFLWQGAGQDRSVSQGLDHLDRLHECGLWAIPRPLTYVKSYGGAVVVKLFFEDFSRRPPDPRIVGQPAREDRRSRRTTYRLVAVRSGESSRRCRESIDVRRLNERINVAAKRRPQVIDRDEQDVGRAPSFLRFRSRQAIQGHKHQDEEGEATVPTCWRHGEIL